MERPFDEELNLLKERLLKMAGLVEESIILSVKALKDRNEEFIRQVFKKEEAINELDIDIEQMALKLLALKQPMAGDLRLIFLFSFRTQFLYNKKHGRPEVREQ